MASPGLDQGALLLKRQLIGKLRGAGVSVSQKGHKQSTAVANGRLGFFCE